MKYSILLSFSFLCAFGTTNAKTLNTIVDAVKNENVELVRQLLAQEKADINCCDPISGKHILLLAVDLQNVELVKAIVEASQKVENPKQKISNSVFIDAYEQSKRKESDKKIQQLLSPRVFAMVEAGISAVQKLVFTGLAFGVVICYVAGAFGIDFFKTKKADVESKSK